MPRDSRGFSKPPADGRVPNQAIDMDVPGSGEPTGDYAAGQLDNRSAAHYGRLNGRVFLGKEIPQLPPSGERQRE